MNMRLRNSLRGEFVASVGWLFADLLLVLTILSFASNPPFISQPSTHPSITPQPTQLVRHLDKTPCNFTLAHLDYHGLLQTPPSAGAILDGEQKVQVQSCLQQHRSQKAGLVLTFGGAHAPDKTTNPNFGMEIAARLNSVVLLELGKQKDFIFTQDTVFASYHDLGSPYGTVELSIYLLT